ncbi:glycosyltransferase family 39 protein [Microbacterium sp. SLBN-146]|uniref:glycosyltransferase family 39 protein n=1 Tax=Microbacterium sp. SLBN-146 TaxID=2768457 RepID=UPI0011712985|nr:glycosyltransferase family 39 protein [Microbacterium sp. SLBN-146]TQJ31850.1 dolichyl-phosphate-mannose-protein mannosyltransferase [Microbacterium sp. SLBN-146]
MLTKPKAISAEEHRADMPSGDPVNAWLLGHLRAGLWLVAVLAVAGVTLVAVLTRPARSAEEAALATPAWMPFLTGGSAAAGPWDGSALATLQIGAYTHLSGAVVRWDSAIFAAREAMVFFALLSAILVWLIARRLRLSIPAAAAATLAFLVVPIGLQTHGLVSADTVALPWALLALLLALSSRRQIAGFVLAGLAFAIATLTSVAFAVMLPLVVWLMVRSTHAGRRAWPLVTGGLMLAAGVAASVLPVVLGGDLDVVGAAIPAALVTITIPIAAIVVAGVVDISIGRMRRKGPTRYAAIGIVSLASAGVLIGMPVWSLLATAPASSERPDATIAAQEWIIDNVDPSQRVVVDDVMRADLLSAGWRDPDVEGYTAASGALPGDWRDADIVVTRQRSDLADASRVVARFGEGPNALEIRQVSSDGLAARTSAAVAAAVDRRRAGSELAENPRLLLTDDARAALAEGRVDERIILVLGALAAEGDVAIDGFPVVEGEEGRTLRQVSLSGLNAEPLAREDRANALATRLIDALQGAFAPDDSSAVDDALVLRYSIELDPLVP